MGSGDEVQMREVWRRQYIHGKDIVVEGLWSITGMFAWSHRHRVTSSSLRLRCVYGRQFNSGLKAWTLSHTDLDLSLQYAI